MKSDLSELNIEPSYRSDRSSILRDFLVPVMRRSTLYRRAVGYFTSSSLTRAARGISALVERDGHIRLIASPVLTEEDIDAINKGYKQRENTILESMRNSISLLEGALAKSRLEALAWLISHGRMDVKIAVRVHQDGAILSGVYHEKIGILSDDAGNAVAFSGSANESESGLVSNFECIEVFVSWDDPQNRVARKTADFDQMWQDRTSGLQVTDFTEVTMDMLQPYHAGRAPRLKSEIELEEIALSGEKNTYPIPDANGMSVRAPADLELRDYQIRAVDNWLLNRGRGILKLATGTGKTITALSAVARLKTGSDYLDALLIVCPYQHLVTQWSEECRSFGIRPLLAFMNSDLWFEELTRELGVPSRGRRPFLAVITTLATFCGDAFQSLISFWPKQTMLIVDEVHHAGAESIAEKLPSCGFLFRLGLSATPERWLDPIGTQTIVNYFGGVLEPQIDVPKAISMGYLCPYEYIAIRVNLSQDEQKDYQSLLEHIEKLEMGGHRVEQSEDLARALARRDRLLDRASGKMDALVDLIQKLLPIERTLIYCGSGHVSLDNEDELERVRRVDAVKKLLGNKLHVRVAAYTAETTVSQRRFITQQLAEGTLEALVAINCLDEGVDIPSVETAVFLASSANPRQFVQRRGRILRMFPGKKKARIFDMIAVPRWRGEPSSSEREIMRRELVRYLEFARAALNRGEAEAGILDLQKEFGLLDI